MNMYANSYQYHSVAHNCTDNNTIKYCWSDSGLKTAVYCFNFVVLNIPLL